ncbi:hypothetical protein WMO33_18275 [Xanthomonas oryzae pv. oryzicola]|uniref:hypothetical protein n=1 Tax=Xanthomonas oryzae TaxID=347 RepID=UPI000A3E25F9|nr:hypothetical protein [Xanthomonas oryzae]ULX24179.1 hypothetical protein IYN96_18255 [Xanthomonas oryzae pv. oryzicola]UNW42225.1 hypothetical protein H4J00_18460 [Xanthomonas oryzae pv. oryzicola]
MKFFAYACFFALLPGCAATEDAKAQVGKEADRSRSAPDIINSAPTQTASPSVVDFVKANYGERNSKGQFISDNGIATICAYRVSSADHKSYFAICSTDAQAGIQIDLYITDESADDIVASETGISSHINDVSILEIGAHNLGFSVLDTTINQATKIGKTSLYTARGEKIRIAASFVSLLDNTSTAECKNDPKSCINLRRKLVGATNPAQKNSPLIIVSGKNSAAIEENKKYILPFDEAKKIYVVPSELKRSL